MQSDEAPEWDVEPEIGDDVVVKGVDGLQFISEALRLSDLDLPRQQKTRSTRRFAED